MALFLSFLKIDKTFCIGEFLVITLTKMVVLVVIKYVSWKPIFGILHLLLGRHEAHLTMGSLSLD